MAAVGPSTHPRTGASDLPLTRLERADADQALTLTILLGWTSYVVSLSQAGKYSPLNALGDALKGVGNGDSALMGGHRGLGVFRSMAGGRSHLSRTLRTQDQLTTSATAVYTITFGVLGFIPAPSVRRRD